MYSISTNNQNNHAYKDFFNDFAHKLASTLCSQLKMIGAQIAHVFKSFFKLTADFIVKFQDICADHQSIGSLITGAEIRVHHTKIATCFHTFLDDISQNTEELFIEYL